VLRPLRKHGEYSRTVKDLAGRVWDIWVLRFRCGSCGHTVSFLPSFCVPHKRHSAQVMALCLHSVLWLGRSVRSTFARFSDRILSYRSLLQAWLRQWHENRVVFLQDSLPRLALSDSFYVPAVECGSPYVNVESVRCYSACCAFSFGERVPSDASACAAEVFVRVQPRLSDGDPPLGLFRPSLTSQRGSCESYP